MPDHLPVVLEFAALAGPGSGEAPLRLHRRGLELIHRALTDADSPYRHVLGALLTLLSPPTEADLAAVVELAAQGPPDEQVGLDAYGTYGDGEFAPPETFVPTLPAAPTRAPSPFHRACRGPSMNAALPSLAAASASGADLLLWVAVPYICLAVFVVGHVWRYRQDQFGWTSRTSQLLEHRWLRRGSPLFQLHALTACLLFAAWPFTRLVHVWSAPVGHLARPCLAHRRRAATPAPVSVWAQGRPADRRRS